MKISPRNCLLMILISNLSTSLLADTIDTLGQKPHEQCGYCHEYDGNSKMPSFPRLAGQSSDYIIKQLHDFRSGKRKGQMQATAELLGDDDIKLVAEYFSQQTIMTNQLNKLPTEQKALAEQLFFHGDDGRGLIACASCHGKGGLGVSIVPRLAGQHESYLYDQLASFKSGARTNDNSGAMRKISKLLNDNEMKALAAFLTRLEPESKKHNHSHSGVGMTRENIIKTYDYTNFTPSDDSQNKSGLLRIDAVNLIHIMTCYNMSL